MATSTTVLLSEISRSCYFSKHTLLSLLLIDFDQANQLMLYIIIKIKNIVTYNVLDLTIELNPYITCGTGNTHFPRSTHCFHEQSSCSPSFIFNRRWVWYCDIDYVCFYFTYWVYLDLLHLYFCFNKWFDIGKYPSFNWLSALGIIMPLHYDNSITSSINFQNHHSLHGDILVKALKRIDIRGWESDVSRSWSRSTKKPLYKL